MLARMQAHTCTCGLNCVLFLRWSPICRTSEQTYLQAEANQVNWGQVVRPNPAGRVSSLEKAIWTQGPISCENWETCCHKPQPVGILLRAFEAQQQCPLHGSDQILQQAKGTFFLGYLRVNKLLHRYSVPNESILLPLSILILLS